MPYTARYREYIYRWRDAHRARYNEYQKIKNKENYGTNKDKIKSNRMGRYYYNKEALLFRFILL